MFVNINVMLSLSAPASLAEENKILKKEHTSHHFPSTLKDKKFLLS